MGYGHILLKDFNYLSVCVVCAFMCACAHICGCLRGPEEGIRYIEVGITGCCELSNMGVGNRTLAGVTAYPYLQCWL